MAGRIHSDGNRGAGGRARRSVAGRRAAHACRSRRRWRGTDHAHKKRLCIKERVQAAAIAAAAYAANPVLPDMTARFVPQQDEKKKGLCWRCGQMWSLRKDGTIRDHSCTPIVGAVAQQPFASAHLPVM